MNSNLFRIALLLTAGVFVVVLLLMNRADSESLSKRIDRYEAHADSLRSVVKTVEAHIHQKDSILLVYLTSLDRTLEELDKEAAKNKQAIKNNLMKQDFMRAAFCEEMASLQQNPEECQQDD